MRVTRRTALSGTLALTAGLSVVPPAWPRSIAGSNDQFGVQLYSLGDEVRIDLDGTLARLREIGYRKVELAGLLGRNASQLRTALDKADMRCTSAHIAAQALGDSQEPTLSGDIGKLGADAQTLGLNFIVLPYTTPAIIAPQTKGSVTGHPGGRISVDAWKATADFLNDKGKALASYGVKIAYHNHNFEFAPVDSTTGYDILMSRTDPTLVHFEMDAGWVAAAGLDTIALLNQYPGRFRLMHVKDIKASTTPNFAVQQDPTEVGSGILPWARILPAARLAGVTEFFVEQEPPFTISRLHSLHKSFSFLLSLTN